MYVIYVLTIRNNLYYRQMVNAEIKENTDEHLIRIPNQVSRNFLLTLIGTVFAYLYFGDLCQAIFEKYVRN